MQLFTSSWAVATVGCGHWLAGWSDTQKERDWKTGDKEIWGRGMWLDLYEWAKKVKMFVSHVNARQRVTSAKGDLSRRGPESSRGENEPLCGSVSTPSLPNGLVNKGATAAGMEETRGLGNVDVTHQGRLATATAEGPTCQQQRSALSPTSHPSPRPSASDLAAG